MSAAQRRRGRNSPVARFSGRNSPKLIGFQTIKRRVKHIVRIIGRGLLRGYISRAL